MSRQDFVRSIPDSALHFGRSDSLWSRFHVDPFILLILVLLSMYGLLVLYSGSGQNIALVKRQFVLNCIAFIAMVLVAQIDLKLLQRWSIWIYLGGLLLLLIVLWMGVGAKGATRWISLGLFRFQPSEIMKLAMPILIAAWFANRVVPPRFQDIVICLAFIAVPVVLIFEQPDLGTSILIAASGLIVLFLAGLQWRYIIGALVIVLASLRPLWVYWMKDYQKQRVLTLLNPDADKLGTGWNIWQSKTAIGSGGIEGKGWLMGTQSQLDFLPESHTDFIIAVLAEEFGLMGVCLLLGLYVLLISRGLFIAWRAKNLFGKLLAGGITLTFFVYVFVNISMVTGLIPVVGVPLPLISYGGTAVVTLLTGFGLLMAIATEKRTHQEY